MIPLTRLNNSSLILNSDLIKFVEQSPDTVLTLVNNEKILVRESAETVVERIVEFRRAVLAGIASPAIPAATPAMGHRPMPVAEADER